MEQARVRDDEKSPSPEYTAPPLVNMPPPNGVPPMMYGYYGGIPLNMNMPGVPPVMYPNFVNPNAPPHPHPLPGTGPSAPSNGQNPPPIQLQYPMLFGNPAVGPTGIPTGMAPPPPLNAASTSSPPPTVTSAQVESSSSAELAQLQQDLQSSHAKLAALDREKDNWVEEMRNLKVSVQTIKSERDHLQQDVERLNEKVKQSSASLLSMEDKLSTTTQALKDSELKSRRKDEELTLLHSKTDSLKHEIDQGKEVLSRRNLELQDTLLKKTAVEKELAELNVRCKKDGEAIRGYVAELDGLKREMQRITSVEGHMTSDNEHLRSQLLLARTSVDDETKRNRTLQGEMEGLRRECTNLRHYLDDTERDKRNLNERLTAARQDLHDAKREIQMLEKQLRDRDRDHGVHDKSRHRSMHYSERGESPVSSAALPAAGVARHQSTTAAQLLQPQPSQSTSAHKGEDAMMQPQKSSGLQRTPPPVGGSSASSHSRDTAATVGAEPSKEELQVLKKLLSRYQPEMSLQPVAEQQQHQQQQQQQPAASSREKVDGNAQRFMQAKMEAENRTRQMHAAESQDYRQTQEHIPPAKEQPHSHSQPIPDRSREQERGRERAQGRSEAVSVAKVKAQTNAPESPMYAPIPHIPHLSTKGGEAPTAGVATHRDQNHNQGRAHVGIPTLEGATPQKVAPFATEANVQQYQAQSAGLEKSLMQLSLEKTGLESELSRLPSHGKTLAARKERQAKETRLEEIAKAISGIRSQLRRMKTLHDY
jgi:hypothetical protein